MRPLSQLASRVTPFLLLFAALSFIGWADSVRIYRTEYVSALTKDLPAADPTSPSGFVGGQRTLIVPGHVNVSYGWIAQTQEMLKTRRWRLRHVSYENAPLGREVHSSAPYRGWMAGIAWIDHHFTGRGLGAAVEHAALYADPALHVLLVASATLFVAWQFGALSSVLVALGLATLYPLGAGYLPATPDHFGLAHLVAFWSTLTLLAGVRSGQRFSPSNNAVHPSVGAPMFAQSQQHWFLVAGLLGGFGLWINVATQAPVIIGSAVGGLLSAVLSRPAPGRTYPLIEAAGWQIWAVTGAAITLVAYGFEYGLNSVAPWELRSVHPMYGFAWLGLGECLTRVSRRLQFSPSAWNRRDAVALILALAAILFLPFAMWKLRSDGFLSAEVSDYVLTKLPQGPAATSLLAWYRRDGFTPQMWATLAPLAILLASGAMLSGSRQDQRTRALIAFAVGPTLVAVAFAWARLRWWHVVDGGLLLIAIAMTAATPAKLKASFVWRGVWTGLAVVVCLSGFFQLVPRQGNSPLTALPQLEVDALIERDLAWWLAKRIGPNRSAVIWAPPSTTSALHYYGNLAGLGTFASENEAGLSAATRLARAGSYEEARALISNRGITHLVLPSWDPYFEEDESADLKASRTPFLRALNHWAAPAWLRPLPYQFSKISGVEDYSVKLFEVVEEQEPAIALSHDGEFFAEMGMLDYAAAADAELRKYPSDLGALTACAQISAARSDDVRQKSVLKAIEKRLAFGGDRIMPWDRRVSLAIVLARNQDESGARTQVEKCLAATHEDEIRSLTPGMLFNFLALVNALGLHFPDSSHAQLALDLLPFELRSRLHSAAR